MTRRRARGPSVAFDPGEIAGPLLRWFRRHRRPLPWRRDRDPYRIWVAEALLQQTRVAQALPYFERFLRRFPTVGALARGSEEEVLKLWEGAGYYARARNLHRAARQVVEANGGHVPTSIDELEELPGIGPYTARAIASQAFDAPVVALEANGLRVAARWTLDEGNVRTPGVRRRLERRLLRLLPTDRAGEFNEALMELGETVCRPRRPLCPRCPVARSCLARRYLPDPGTLPVRSTRAPKPTVEAAVVGIRRKGRWLVQRRSPNGLLGGLWEFPGGKIEPGEPPAETARREILEETGLRLGTLTPAGVVRHEYSHFRVRLHLFYAESSAGRPRGRLNQRWVTDREFDLLPRPGATRRALGPLRSLARARR